jgi:hypothetical protein
MKCLAVKFVITLSFIFSWGLLCSDGIYIEHLPVHVFLGRWLVLTLGGLYIYVIFNSWSSKTARFNLDDIENWVMQLFHHLNIGELLL